MRQALTYGLTGQEVEFYPPERDVIAEGAAAAATYAVFGGEDSNDATPALSGTATLDSVNTTVATSDAGYAQANRRKAILASTSGILPRRQYLLANAGLVREVVTPFEVQSSYVTLENDLAGDYPIASSTFKGLRQSFVIDPTFIATIGNINTGPERMPPYRVRWQYQTAAGVTRQMWTYFDVVRVAARHHVTARALRAWFPEMSEMEWRDTRGQQFEQQLNAGWHQFVFDYTAENLAIDQLREGPVLDHVVTMATLFVLAVGGLSPQGRNGEAWVSERMDAYREAFTKAFKATEKRKGWEDSGTTGAIDPNPSARAPHPFFVR